MTNKIEKSFESWKFSNTIQELMPAHMSPNEMINYFGKRAWDYQQIEINQLKTINDGLLYENEKMLTEIKNLKNKITKLERVCIS